MKKGTTGEAMKRRDVDLLPVIQFLAVDFVSNPGEMHTLFFIRHSLGEGDCETKYFTG